MTTFSPVGPDVFMKQRVDDQIEWYSKKGTAAKRKYYTLQIIQIILGALLPLLAGFADDKHAWMKYTIAVFGVVIAINGGLLALFRFQELWTEYRATSEALKHEKFLFQTGTAPYDRADAYPSFVATVESLISSQNAEWLKRRQRDRRPNDDKPRTA